MGRMRSFLKQWTSTHPRLNALVRRLRRRPVFHRVSRRIRGKRNRWQAHWTAVIDRVSVEVHGNDNIITIGSGCDVRHLKIRIYGDGHRITIANNVRFSQGGTLWFEDSGGSLDIGPDTTIEAADISITERGSRVEIGRDCMLAYDIDIRTGDSHSILDANTRSRLNPAACVRLGDHVWVAAHCILLKGSALADDSILAAGAVLTKAIAESGCVVGGNPARILKRGVTWDRRRL